MTKEREQEIRGFHKLVKEGMHALYIKDETTKSGFKLQFCNCVECRAREDLLLALDESRAEVEDLAQKERYRIGQILSRVANQIYRKQIKDYPSNILDVLRAWLGGWKLGHGHTQIEDWFYETLEIIEKEGNKEKA